MTRRVARELGVPCSPEGRKALVDTSYRAIVRSKSPPAGVLKPRNADASGTSGAPAWLGEGQYLYAVGSISDSNFITGLTYLLNRGIETVSRCNHNRVRAQTMAFTEGVLALGRQSRRSLNTVRL